MTEPVTNGYPTKVVYIGAPIVLVLDPPICMVCPKN